MLKFIYLTNDDEKAIVNDIMSNQETAGHLISNFEGPPRAFIQVPNNNNHRCTFVILWTQEWRSVPIGDISKQVTLLVTKF